VAAKPPLALAEVERVLRALAPLSSDRSIVLVGGQAVAFWASVLESRGVPAPAADLLTSKDVDFEGNARAARRAAELLGGVARIPSMDEHTPNTGLVLFNDSEGIDREIDFIGEPLGLRHRDVRDTAVLLTLDSADQNDVPLWLMHPERCMESRVYNVQVLRHDDDQAIRKLCASIVCAREWSRLLLGDEGIPDSDRVRAVLRINERIFKKVRRRSPLPRALRRARRRSLRGRAG
jgi:hypothetical protein